jgi:hypothetical protein
MLLDDTSQEIRLVIVNSNRGRNAARQIGVNQGAEKSIVVMLYSIRTANRHRWMGRESQGVRINVR